jgi:transcription antitermination factor NusG
MTKEKQLVRFPPYSCFSFFIVMHIITKERRDLMFKKIMLGSVDLSVVPKEYVWYTVVTKFNYEEKYIDNVQQAIQDTNLEKLISEYYIPIKYTKEKIKLVDGTEKDKIHKVKGCFSNYVFVKCIMTEKLWNLLRTTTGASIIISTGGIPSYLYQNDIESMQRQQCIEGFTEQEEKELKQRQKEKYYMFDSNSINIDEVLIQAEKKGNK